MKFNKALVVAALLATVSATRLDRRHLIDFGDSEPAEQAAAIASLAEREISMSQVTGEYDPVLSEIVEKKNGVLSQIMEMTRDRDLSEEE